MSDALFELLRSQMQRPINLLDVGAAGGVIQGWEKFGDKARVFCFEARDDEAEKIADVNENSNIRYFNIALSDDDEGFDLNVTINPGCSSVYPPLDPIYRRYPGNYILTPVKKVRCKTITVDRFMTEQGLNAVHAMKIDTQGSELDILRKAEQALRHCLFLNIEVEFNELYRGQALFCDIDRFLRDRGFALWRLNNLAHYSTGRVGGAPNHMLIGSDPGGAQMVQVPHGQLFWGDALYVRADATPTSAATLEREDAIAAAALAVQWNFHDLALEMIRKSGDESLLRQAYALLDSSFAEDFPTMLGPEEFNLTSLAQKTSAGLEVDFVETNACAIFGPYLRLPFGDFEAEFLVEAIGLEMAREDASVLFDVANDTLRVAGEERSGQDVARLGSRPVKMLFRNESPLGAFEFRLWLTGRPAAGKLLFKGVRLRRL